jgi:surface protein
MKKLFLLASITLLSLIFVSCKSTSTDSTTRYQVSLAAVPIEGGSVSPASGQYDEGTTIDISATPNEGWLFIRWEGDYSGTSSTATITVDSDKNIEAIFERRTYALTVNTTGEGTVDEQIVANKTTDYESGTVVELTANPAEGWEFVEWQGDLTGTANPQQITIDEPREVTAVFEQTGFALDVTVNGQGTVTISPDQPVYDPGTIVELTANPAEGWEFVEWQGDLTGTANPQQITIDEPREVTAVFEQTGFALDVTVNGQGTVIKNPDQSVYDPDTIVELTANPDTGWQFEEWQGAATGSNNPVQVTMDGPKEVTAVFTEQSPSSLFYLDTNGVTVKCENAEVGDSGVVNGVLYTKRTASEITPANAETTCTSEITSMNGMFEDAESFNGNISSWDVSSVTDMGSMFEWASSFNGDLSSWDVSSVMFMGRMFYRASSFNGDIGDWDVSSATGMGRMFYAASSFNGDIGDWDVSSVTDMSSMFERASSFNGNISSWNVSSVTNMSSMFWDAQSFNQDLSGWDVSSVSTISSMFWGAGSFNGNLSGWDVSSVTNMFSMFRNAYSFNGDLNGWNVSNVISMEDMFNGADSFNGDISSWDVSNVTDMSSMFNGAHSFNQDIGGWDVSSVTNMSSMFANTSSFNVDLNSWNVSNVLIMEGMFSGASSFNGNISSWDVSNVYLIRYMFSGASSFNGDLSNWDMSGKTSLADMFTNATAFNGDISGWDVSGVTTMNRMFERAFAFNGDIGDWDVSSVTDMFGMFWDAQSFNQDLSGWCVTNITTEPGSFSSGSPLQESFKPVWGTCPGS